MSNRIFLSSPHMTGKEIDYINEAFDTNWIAPLGPNVDSFEKELARAVGTKGAAALASGTAAIHLALKCCGVSAGDYVFCSALTFSASCNPIIYENAVPVFIDCDNGSFLMSPKALELAFAQYTPKAVIVVNLYGQSADMDEILKICSAHGVPVIEDAAESLGATYGSKMSGTLGQFGIYSFNGNKIITTSGGGMLVSNDLQALDKARFWATQARDKARHYQHSELGYNYRMSNIVAGIGRAQLKVLDERVAQKKAIYDTYKLEFKDIPYIQMMPVFDYGKPNYWLSVCTLAKNSPVTPEDIFVQLDAHNIESRPVWKPMQLQPFFEKYPFFTTCKDPVSYSEDLFNRGVCLPSDTKMDADDLSRVITAIRDLF